VYKNTDRKTDDGEESVATRKQKDETNNPRKNMQEKTTSGSSSSSCLTIGVLALQGAFEEHQKCFEAIDGCRTVQVGVVPCCSV
jgi:hypothetical protein